MSKTTKNPEAELLHLRASVRRILIEEGCSVAPFTLTNERIDDLISDIANRFKPALEREQQAALDGITDRTVEIEVSDHFGKVMSAYGDAGYFVGVCVGLELAALSSPAQLPPAFTGTKRQNRSRKAGAR